MKWYWLIYPANVNAKQFVADCCDLQGWVERDFERGELIQSWDGRACLRATKCEWDGKPDDVLQAAVGLPIFSRRLRELLEKAGVQGIQYLPIAVLHQDGREVEGYSIANVLNYVSALDRQRARYKLWGDERRDRTGQIRDLRRPVLLASRLRGYHIV